VLGQPASVAGFGYSYGETLTLAHIKVKAVKCALGAVSSVQVTHRNSCGIVHATHFAKPPLPAMTTKWLNFLSTKRWTKPGAPAWYHRVVAYVTRLSCYICNKTVQSGGMKPNNPFHPAFGALPPVLIGRDDILNDVRDGLLEGPGSEFRTNKAIGPRGVGKTVVLEAAANIARELGWVVINVTAGSGMLAEILDIAIDRTAHLIEGPRRSVTDLGLGPVKLGISAPKDSHIPGWRIQMERILEVLENHHTGIFFTVDEVAPNIEELKTFGKRYQHFQREGRNVALLVAGLPLNVEAFQQLPDTTFIRRAIPHDLSNVSISAVRTALRQTFTESGKQIDAEALRFAAEATEGYPFLVQLVGAQIWRNSQGDYVSLDDVKRGVEAARRRIGDTVHSSSLADLSPVAKTFLIKMAQDDGPSRMKDITARANWSAEQSNVYRSRLITAGMIRPAGHGLVEFAFPYLREYLLEHASTLVWNELS